MRSALPLLCVAALGSCRAPSDGNGADGKSPIDVVSLLKSGDATVCVDPLVHQTLERSLVSSTVMGEALYDKMIAAGRHLTFDAVSMSSRNREIGEVTCSATLISGGFNIPIDYTLRPEASGDKFILSWTSDDPVEMVQGAIVSAVPLRENTAAAPQSQEHAPAESVPPSVTDATEDTAQNNDADSNTSAAPDGNTL